MQPLREIFRQPPWGMVLSRDPGLLDSRMMPARVVRSPVPVTPTRSDPCPATDPHEVAVAQLLERHLFRPITGDALGGAREQLRQLPPQWHPRIAEGDIIPGQPVLTARARRAAPRPHPRAPSPNSGRGGSLESRKVAESSTVARLTMSRYDVARFQQPSSSRWVGVRLRSHSEATEPSRRAVDSGQG